MRAARILIVAVAFASSAASAQEPPATGSGPELRVTVAVDLSGLPERTVERIDALGLETRVITRLLQEGFAVVAPFARPHVLLRAEEQDGNVKLVAQAGNTEEAVIVSLATGTRAELQLEIAQKLVDLARSRAQYVAQVLAQPPPQPTGPGEAPPPPRAVIIPQVPPPPKREYSAVEASVGVDAVWRGAVDPQLRAGLSISGESVLGVALTGAWSPSSAEGLAIHEWQLTAGPRVRLFAANELLIHGSVMVGGLAYRFDAADPAWEEGSGDRFDVLLMVPVELQWKVKDWLGLGARLAPGVSPRALENRREGEIRYRREAARLEGGATLSIKL